MKTILILVAFTLLAASLSHPGYKLFLDILMSGGEKEIFKKYHYVFNKPYDLNSNIALEKYSIFKDNLKIIEENNLKGKGKMGIGPFTDITYEQYKNSYLGLTIPTSNELKEFLKNDKIISFNDYYKSNSLSDSDFDYSIDWSSLYPPADDQNKCKSCYAFSTVGVLEGLVKKLTGNFVYLSKQQVIDCNIYLTGCERGGSLLEAYNYMMANGLVKEEEYPYTAIQGTCTLVGCETRKSIKPYVLIDRLIYCDQIKHDDIQHLCNEKDFINAIKRGPFSSSIYAGEKFQNYIAEEIIRDEDCIGKAVNHGVLVVAVTKDYFKIRNSHGDMWGEDGFGFISRKGNACGLNSTIFQPLDITIIGK